MLLSEGKSIDSNKLWVLFGHLFDLLSSGGLQPFKLAVVSLSVAKLS